MNLSKETIAILKNFSTINQNFYCEGGTNEISTWTIKKNIFAKAKLDEEIPSQLPIYDMKELLDVVDFYKDGVSTVIDIEEAISTISDGGASKINYTHTDPDLLVYPDQDIHIDNYNVTFDLTHEDISGIMKAASIIGAPDIEIKNNDGSIDVKVFDLKLPSGNTFELNLGNVETDFKFTLKLKIDNLKIMRDKDYTLSIAEGKNLIFLKSVDGVVEYYIAIEKNSILGE